MPFNRTYQCLNCGYCFSVSLLTPEEAEDQRRSGNAVGGTGDIQCPECSRTDIREGCDHRPGSAPPPKHQPGRGRGRRPQDQ